MPRPRILVAVALVALPACGGDEPAPVGHVSERPSGTLVYVTGSNRLTAVDVATGRRRARTVSSVATCGPEVFVTAGHVVFAGVRKGRTTVFSAPLSLDRPPRLLGPAHQFVRSATPGRVWLAGTDCNRRRMVGVREVTVDGRVTAATRRRVPGTWVEAAVPGGLVVLRDRALSVWDPRTNRGGGRLALSAVTGTRGDLLVGCRGRCDGLTFADAASGRTVDARAGRGRLDLGAALSPGGSRVAAPAYRDRRWRVVLVDTRSGRTTTVPGTRTGRTYPTIAWAPSGWLFIRGRRDRVLAYRPGIARAIPLPLRLPAEAPSFGAG
jgi:hypothetical protein